MARSRTVGLGGRGKLVNYSQGQEVAGFRNIHMTTSCQFGEPSKCDYSMFGSEYSKQYQPSAERTVAYSAPLAAWSSTVDSSREIWLFLVSSHSRATDLP